MRKVQGSGQWLFPVIVLALVFATLATGRHGVGMPHSMNRGMGMMHRVPQTDGSIGQTRPDAQAVPLTIRDWQFDQDDLRIPPGKVDLVVMNEGNRPHGLWLEEFGINADIGAGTTVIIPIDNSAEGTYAFFCNTAFCGTPVQHSNMRGTLTVKG